jgi:hypothetical protein
METRLSMTKNTTKSLKEILKPSFKGIFDDSILLPLGEISESLDNPYKLENVTKSVPLEEKVKLQRLGYQNLEFHQCLDEPGHAFFLGRKDGAYEIHHQHVKDGVELSGKNLMDKMPSRFVSTAFHLADKHLKIGHSVRIIATEDHIDGYHRLSKMIAKRKNYVVSEPQDQGNGTSAFTVKRSSDYSLLGSIFPV